MVRSASESTPRQAPSFPSPRPESALRRWGGDGPPWPTLGWGESPGTSQGDPSPRTWSGLLPTGNGLRGIVQQRGRRCPCLKFFAHLICCQNSKIHVMRQSDLQSLVISSRCVSLMQKFERYGWVELLFKRNKLRFYISLKIPRYYMLGGICLNAVFSL